jgi:2-keto-4-pentenoate hydratase/2-oxohepta-3-ene-1,7-dioic acid hydratase in catechol pathway
VRIARFAKGDGVAYGVVEGEPESGGRPPRPGLTIAELYGHPFGVDPGGVRLTGNRFPLAEVRLLAPVLPSKVVAAGRNYASHAREMNGDVSAKGSEPVIFLKPSTSVTGPGDAIKYPVKITDRVDYEGELAVIIGRLCRQVPRERAEEVVFGYTCANDVTARDLQARDGQWTRAKGFDTFCPLGPWIETGTNPTDLELTTTLNGEVRQRARTSELLVDVPALIAYVSQVMTLLPGDVLLTGTPGGVGPLTDGDEVSVTIESIGTLTNRVVIGD